MLPGVRLYYEWKQKWPVVIDMNDLDMETGIVLSEMLFLDTQNESERLDALESKLKEEMSG